MFREMRLKKQMMTTEDAIDILNNNTSGVLAVSGDDGYPYTVPLNYVYQDSKIYFHSANSGHKLDAIRRNSKVSFCVIHQDQIVPEEYTSYYKSVVVFGTARILEDANEKKRAITLLGNKYCSDYEAGYLQEIEKKFHNFSIIELSIDHMTGKQAIELMQH